ncbi:MAG TPA: uroporphyrinogen decarboxylase family protein [Tepidisphaeraceae bacterium]|jgi:hypothetical protein|nr:uroporphyrinogen decarboxylase family protein [Tepidisphaeraceae bacterium]
MNGKERMMLALLRQKPDRLPVTIHQWQPYHLEKFMGGIDQLQAFIATGLDASVTPGVGSSVSDPDWQYRSVNLGQIDGQHCVRHFITTPEGELTWVSGGNEYTTFNIEHIIKNQRDAEIFLRYWPDQKLNREVLTNWYDRTNGHGIVRGFVASFAQPGPWQEFCEMVGTERAIFWAIDDPPFVHHFLDAITKRKVDYVHREMGGAKYDLIEHGGGAASSTVISPEMFDEFCVPYDRRIIDALHEQGFPVVYHTCGGMLAILDHIPRNGCDASETLSPRGVGGDIGGESRLRVKEVLGSQVSLIGGIDQGAVLTNGSPPQIAQQVQECFATFGAGGGYICSASDHFFHTPVENLKALARAGQECHY